MRRDWILLGKLIFLRSDQVESQTLVQHEKKKVQDMVKSVLLINDDIF